MLMPNCFYGFKLPALNRQVEEEEGFYKLRLALLSYGTILTVERQTCRGALSTV